MVKRPKRGRPLTNVKGWKGGHALKRSTLGLAGDRLAELERLAKELQQVTAEHARRGRVPSHWMAL